MKATTELAERVEREAWRDLYDAPAARLRARLGLRAEDRGGELVLTAPGVDGLLFNRVFGAPGADKEAAAAQLARAAEHFPAHGVARWLAHVYDEGPPGALDGRAEALGVERFRRRWVKFLRGPEAPPTTPTGLPIEPATAVHVGPAAELLAAAFDLPPAGGAVLAGAIGRPRWRVWVALAGPRPVAIGALFVDRGVGSLAYAATAPEFRGRGAQGALLAQRIRTAVELGCRFLASETGAPIADEPNPSWHNLLRHGFAPVATRANFVPRGTRWARAA
jgi:GNAT superfamily N-acetyltransferase